MSVKIYNVGLKDIKISKPKPLFIEYLVVQTSGNQILKLDTDGNIIGSPISNTPYSIQSVSPTIALDLDNNIYAASQYGVKKYDFDGNQLWSLSLGSHTINGITLDKDNKIYAASSEGYVKTIFPDGTNANHQYATGLDAYAVSVNKNGSILIGSTSAIMKVNSNDNFTISISGTAYSVFIDNDEESYIGQSGTSQSFVKYLESGTVDWTVSSIKNIDCVFADREGNSYVGTAYNPDASYNYSISKVDPNGNVLWTQNENNIVYSVVVDSTGNVYTSNKAGYITKYDPNGNQLWRNNSIGSEPRSIAITGSLPSQW
jgi:hypothetical protein